MVQTEKELINIFRNRFECIGDSLFWKTGRLKGKKAGYVVKSGHIMVSINISYKNTVRIFSHRIVFSIHNGYIPNIIDHIDRNPLNNSINNLREADKTINSINRNPPKNNKTGYRGVSYNSKLKVYYAQIKVKQKKIHLGTFKNIEDAVTKRKEAEEFFWSDFRTDEKFI